ncbi:uncharacterized protein C19orf44 homolog isoform X2 [Lineus longissimus]|uniref:uncharacterized protein C19orf44 homolog isoform X2 n=1 Tax=Lineus longissimus TaxID=88925 RepID=UPI00315DBF55
MYKKNAARSLIERASCQLRGEKAPVRVSTEEEDIQAYLSGLSKKTGDAAGTTTSTPAKPKPAFAFEEFSDLSLSEGDLTPRKKKKTPAATNKYLKKKTESVPEKPSEKIITKPVTKKDDQKENSAPTGGRTVVNSAANKSSPLSKIAAFEEKFRNKKANAAKYQMSDSDLDSMTFSTSMENELAKEVPGLKQHKMTKSRPSPKNSPDQNNNDNFLKKKPTVTSGQPSLSKTMHKFSTKNNLSKLNSDEDSSSLGIGKGSSKFIKKKPVASKEPAPAVSTKTADVRNSPTATKKLRFDLSEDSDMMDLQRRKSADPPLPSTQPLKPALKTSSSFRKSMESDSDLADYMDFGDVSSSTTTSSPRRKAVIQRQRSAEEEDLPRPSSKTSSSFGETVILSDPFEALDHEEEPSIQESIDTDDSYKNDQSAASVPSEVNIVMDIGSLEPIGQTKKKEQKRPKSPETKKKSDKKSDRGKSSDTKSKTKASDNDFFSSMGLMSVDDLLGAREISDEDMVAPVLGEKKPNKADKKTEKKKPKKKSETADLFSNFGLQTIDDLLGGGVSEESIRDESEILEVPETPHSEITTEIRSVSDARSLGYSYDDDFESEIKTEVSKKSREDSIPYSEDFETSVSEILTEKETPRRKPSYSETDSDTLTPTPSDDETVSYSESYTSYTDSRTSYTDSRSVVVLRKKETRAVEVQTGLEGGLGYRWNTQGVGMSYMEPPVGLGYTDPTPIASHVVSPDSIEAMTAYSPNVIALNDMLRMQIQLTQQFVTMQRRLYDSFSTSIEDSYQYTTLEDTKEYIKQHRKQTLTFDEALKMVKEEMGER